MNADQKAEFGRKVADLKAYLHDVENQLSSNQEDAIDYNTLNTKVNDLLVHTKTPTQQAQPPTGAHPPGRGTTASGTTGSK